MHLIRHPPLVPTKDKLNHHDAFYCTKETNGRDATPCTDVRAPIVDAERQIGSPPRSLPKARAS